MPKSLTARVNDSFADENADAVWRYLEVLRARWKELADATRRSSALILLAVLYELLSSAKVQEVNVLGIPITPSAEMLAFFPTAVAYFYLDAVLKTTQCARLRHVHDRVFRLWNERASDERLNEYLEPQLPLYWNPMGRTRSEHAFGYERTQNFIHLALFVAMLLAPLAFEVYAFIDLLTDVRPSYALLAFNALAAAGLLGAAIWHTASLDDELPSEYGAEDVTTNAP